LSAAPLLSVEVGREVEQLAGVRWRADKIWGKKLDQKGEPEGG
jgi:hypothetical protein